MYRGGKEEGRKDREERELPVAAPGTAPANGLTSNRPAAAGPGGRAGLLLRDPASCSRARPCQAHASPTSFTLDAPGVLQHVAVPAVTRD